MFPARIEFRPGILFQIPSAQEKAQKKIFCLPISQKKRKLAFVKMIFCTFVIHFTTNISVSITKVKCRLVEINFSQRFKAKIFYIFHIKERFVSELVPAMPRCVFFTAKPAFPLFCPGRKRNAVLRFGRTSFSFQLMHRIAGDELH